MLASIGQPAFRPMMDYWAAHPASYQVRLGVSVALTEYLRDHKRDRKAVSAELGERDLLALAVAAGEDDRTLRVYASEFLYDLGDPRIVPIAAKLFDQASEDGRYNLVVVHGRRDPRHVRRSIRRSSATCWKAGRAWSGRIPRS